METTLSSFDILNAFLFHATFRPNSIAVETNDAQLTYADLNRRANAIHQVFEENGLVTRSIIPLVLHRGVDLVAAELAALKLGAAFLPIDPEQPKLRICEISRQSQAPFVVTSKVLRAKLAALNLNAIFIEECNSKVGIEKVCKVTEDDLAYIVFTSGTTGIPKGVMISRRSLNNFCRYWIGKLGLGPNEKMTVLASPGFDTSIDEIWPALASGATLSIPDDESRFAPHLLQSWINARSVTVCDAPTAVAEMLLDRPWPKTALKVLIAGGDRLTRYPAENLPFRLLNAYGPTEHTIVSSVEDVLPVPAATNPAIGRPISETEIYIVDEDFHLLPAEEVGEIIISGIGIARGYLRAPDQTADKFVPNPFSGEPGARCYRTGDAGSKDSSGRLFFHGRVDSQLNIRGNRVEPQEISWAIKKHPHVEDAFVTLFNEGSGESPGVGKLVAYYVPKDRSYTPTNKELTEFLRDTLPSYMIPDCFVVVGQMPLNLSGKVDAKLLPAPSFLSRDIRKGKKPTTDTQNKILELWQKVLGFDQIGVDENFFDLGGHSLAAIRIIAGLSDLFDKTISLRQFYEFPTIEALEFSMPTWSAIPSPPIVKNENRDHYPLSFQQEQVVFFQNLTPASNAYNSQSTIKIRGCLDHNVLSEAVNAIIARHEILRTTYTYLGREPVQIIHERFRLAIPLFDLSLAAEPLQEREELITRLLGTVFDLSRLPLAEWSLIKLSEEEHDLVLVEHHIVHDGWTLSIIFRELQEYYNAIVENRAPEMPELPVQYRDFAIWQRRNINRDYFNGQLEFWKKELNGAPRVTALPYDLLRPSKQTFCGDLICLDLPEQLSTMMKNFAKSNRFTFFEIMFSVFSLLIHKLSGQNDVCIGSALANRERPETLDLIGMFVNVVIIRSILKDPQSFTEYVRAVKSKIVNANMNQAFPFPRLVQELNWPRDAAINPIFQVMFSFHDSTVLDPVLGAANCFIDHLRGNSSAKQDLDVVVIPRQRRNREAASESDERISMMWEFNSDLFLKTTIQRFIDRYLHALEACLSNGDIEVRNLDILSQQETSKVLQFSAPVTPHRMDILGMIYENFQSRPAKECVVEDSQVYSYRDLSFQTHRIKMELGPSSQRAEEPVGILLPRGFLNIASQLAVLETERVFVPIDPTAPAGRVHTILKEAGVETVVTTPEHRGLLPPAIRSICVGPSSPPEKWAQSHLKAQKNEQCLAYIIFTSGSTGIPKGVAVQADSLFGYAARNIVDFNLTCRSRVLVYNSPGFDTSLGDIWPGLAAGATLYVPSEEVRYSVTDLIEFIAVNRITFADIPTAMAEKMLKAEWPGNYCLETLLVGGEKLKLRPTESHTFRLYNEYGPTETTVSATSGLVTAGNFIEVAPDLGRPIAGRGCLVLNENLQLVPIGVEGDLYITGEGLARGYYRNPSMTAERFIPNPYDSHGTRMYYTGDVAKWTLGGTLRFCGRRDRQIKIHGFRIELEEISSKIAEIPGVTGAYSLVRELKSGKKEIFSFYSSDDANEPSSIKMYLSGFLPSYMLPSKIIFLMDLPKTISGKVDEEKLWAFVPPEESSSADWAGSVVSPIQERLVQIWQTLLGIQAVGVHQNFFEIGGHSLLLAELQGAIEQDFGIKIPIFDFFEFTTVELLAVRIASFSEKTSTAREFNPAKKNLLRKRVM